MRRITEVRSGKMPTMSVRRRISRLSRSIIRPSLSGQACPSFRSPPSSDGVEVVLEGFGDVPVSFFLAGPAAVFGVGLECPDVGELVGERRLELGGGGVVVAGLTDVGVGAGPLGF